MYLFVQNPLHTASLCYHQTLLPTIASTSGYSWTHFQSVKVSKCLATVQP